VTHLHERSHLHERLRGKTTSHIYAIATVSNQCDRVDLGEDTRDLISRGLASDTRKNSILTEIGSSERDSAPARNMNVSHIRLPLTHVVQAEEPSTRGLNMAYGDNVKGQNYNIII